MKIVDTNTSEYDMLFKIILIGDSGVGKTSILMRFSDDVYSDSYISTIGVDFKTKMIQLDSGKIVKMQLWDTAGQERFRTITSSYYRGAHGIIIVYDVCDAKSFDNVSQWKQEIIRANASNVPVLLVGNKADVAASVRQVTYEKGKAKADEMNANFIEMSAKTSKGVFEAFSTIVEQIRSKMVKDILEGLQVQKNIVNKPLIDVPKPHKKKDGCC